MRSKNFFIKLFIPFFVLVLLGPGCKGVSPEIREAKKPVVLEYWRIFDPSDSLNDVTADWNALHPNIQVNMRTIRFEEFEDEVINALAEDRGPDIFSIPNTAVNKYKSKLTPAPSSVKLAFQEVRGTIKKEIVTVIKTLPGVTVKELRDKFVDQVTSDVLVKTSSQNEIKQEIYGLPFALDSLVMFYNRELFNQAKITSIPKNWTDFQEAVKKLTKANAKGELTQSGAALGTSKNVEVAADLLSVIMMQNQTLMTDETGTAVFDKVPPNLAGRPVTPGEEALVFYTNFASPAKEVYTWNDAMPNALDAFAAGKTAVFFGYSYHIPLLKVKAPKLNWSIAKIPQIGGTEANFANYLVEVVSKKTKHTDEAWAFLQFVATNKDEARKYLTRVKRPTALRELIPEQLDDIELGPFAESVLTARSWYKGLDPDAARNAFHDMINQVASATLEPREALGIAVAKVNQTLR